MNDTTVRSRLACALPDVPRSDRGTTIVELLVGLAIGLVVIAGAATLLARQLHEQRALLAETRLTQDLRNATDLIARDLRRAGYWGDATAGVWSHGAAPLANPYAAVASMAAASDTVRFAYSRDGVEDQAVGDAERTGFRLHGHTIEARLGDHWQALTDASTLVVTAFELMPNVDDIDLSALCARPCDAAAAAAGTCPPRQQVRRVTVRIAGHAAGAARPVRSAQAQVRLRNDAIDGTCAG